MINAPAFALPQNEGKMEVIPLSLAEANIFVKEKHRHHSPVQGHKFSIGAEIDGRVIGVAIVGRPVARMLDNGWTLEVTRLCTDGTKNACSFLYSWAWKAARALGYKRLITYTLRSENGVSLKAANFHLVGEAGGGSWNRRARPRIDKNPTQGKLLWEKK